MRFAICAGAVVCQTVTSCFAAVLVLVNVAAAQPPVDTSAYSVAIEQAGSDPAKLAMAIAACPERLAGSWVQRHLQWRANPSPAKIPADGGEKAPAVDRAAPLYITDTGPWNVVFGPTGSLAACGGAGGVTIWNLSSGVRERLLVSDSPIGPVAWSADGRTIIGGDEQGQLKVWDAVTGEAKATMAAPELEKKKPGPDENDPLAKLRAGGAVRALAISPDASRIVTNNGAQMSLWDAAAGKVVASLGAGGAVMPIPAVFSVDGKMVATGGMADAGLFNAADGSEVKHLARQGPYVMAVALSGDGRLLATGASGSMSRQLRVQTVAEDKVTATMTGHDRGINAVAFSPDGVLLASGSVDRTIRVWDVQTGAQLMKLALPSGVGSVSFSPDGRKIAFCIRGRAGYFDSVAVAK